MSFFIKPQICKTVKVESLKQFPYACYLIASNEKYEYKITSRYIKIDNIINATINIFGEYGQNNRWLLRGDGLFLFKNEIDVELFALTFTGLPININLS
jgi:hypothetical protein